MVTIVGTGGSYEANIRLASENWPFVQPYLDISSFTLGSRFNGSSTVYSDSTWDVDVKGIMSFGLRGIWSIRVEDEVVQKKFMRGCVSMT